MAKRNRNRADPAFCPANASKGASGHGFVSALGVQSSVRVRSAEPRTSLSMGGINGSFGLGAGGGWCTVAALQSRRPIRGMGRGNMLGTWGCMGNLRPAPSASTQPLSCCRKKAFGWASACMSAAGAEARPAKAQHQKMWPSVWTTSAMIDSQGQQKGTGGQIYGTW